MTFHDFPGPRQDSRTFQALENVLIKFHDFSWLSRTRGNPGYCEQIINISYFYDLLESVENRRRLITCGFIFRAHAGTHRFTTIWGFMPGKVPRTFNDVKNKSGIFIRVEVYHVTNGTISQRWTVHWDIVLLQNIHNFTVK